MPYRILRIAGPLAWTFCLAAGLWSAPATAEAGVVVVDNRSDHTVQFALEPTWKGESRYSLAPSRLIAVQVPDTVELNFRSGQALIRRRLSPNTLHEFYNHENNVDVRQFLFSVGPWPQESPPVAPPDPVVVPVKLLADAAYPGGQAAWEPQLRTQLETASKYLELYCGVRFQVAAVEPWKPQMEKKDFALAAESFSKTDLGPGWLAIGVISGLEAPPVSFAHQPRQPLFTHMLLPDLHKDFSSGQQLELLIHDLGHYLGAVHSKTPNSIMRANPLQPAAAGDGSGFDGLNALVMNMVADELRNHGKATAEVMSRSSREYLRSIYREMATRLPSDSEIPRYAELIREPVLPNFRYLGQWVDGTRVSAATVGPWTDTRPIVKLGGRSLFDANIPIRWLIDNSLALPPPPEASVEFVGGDCLPGRVIAFRDGAEPPKTRLPPHLVVVPTVRLDPPDAPARADIRVSTDWIRRIIWQRVTDQYQPRTLFFPDGRQLEFRSLRFAASSVQLLRDDGIRDVRMAEIAEIHFPQTDPWNAYYEQLAALAPADSVRLVRLETNNGIRATGTTERFHARSHGSPNEPSSWFHLVQPAWSIDPMWLPHESIRVRQYFKPHEVPLSRIEPSRVRQESDLGGVWRWQADRNVEGGVLESGGVGSAWGLGVHALCELEFLLPPSAKSFQTRLGLDQAAGNGGCVRASVRLDSVAKPLFASNLMIGSAEALDTGKLMLESTTNARRLTLAVDPAPREGPPGTDPLDIRDTFDWLEPMVELDAEQLRTEVLRRGPGTIPAWQNWTVMTGESPTAKLVTLKEESQRGVRFLLGVSAAQEPLRVTGKLSPRPYRDRLQVSVSRPQRTPPSKLEIRVDGKPVGRFDIPERSTDEPKPIVISLAAYHGRTVPIELIQHSPDDKSFVEWGAIWLVGRTTGP